MAQFPKKPSKGDRVLQSLYNTVCDIVDYLPSLNVVGDNKTTYVNHSAGGTTIHAFQPSFSTSNKSNEYIAGSGIVFTSGNIINAKLSAGPNINIDYNSGWLVISGTPAGSGGGGGGSGYTYTGDGDLGSGHIFVDYSYTNPVICSNLRYIDDLLNYPISGDGIGSELHFAQIRDIKDGAGTKIDYHWNSIGDSTEEGGQLIKFIDGVCVNLNVSGGTYITTKFHQGVGYGDYTSASIDCNLSGDRDINNSGLITIVPQYDIEQNITGGVISSVLHAGSGINIDSTGEITCTVEGGGGTTVIFKAPDFAKLQVANDAGEQALGLGNTFIIPVSNGSTVRYSADGGTIIARWAPVEGSSKNGFEVTTTNKTTTDDGYVRISVIDPGTLEYGCLRLYVDNKDIPLHKFAKFSYSSGTNIQITTGGVINCTLTGTSQLTNNSNYITLADIPPSTTYIGTSGIVIEPILDENQQPTTSSFIGLSTVYDLLSEGPNIKLTKLADGKTQISGTPEGSGGGGGGGGLNIVYITTQDQRVVVPNTKYCLAPIASLSTNAINFPDMDPTAISSFETDNYERIYKYFFAGFDGSRPEYLYETISARIDGDVQYGAYDPKNNNWKSYMEGSQFGNMFIFEPQQQDCVVEIDCGIGGNAIAVAPSGLVWSTFSDDVISGTPQSWYEAWRTDTWPPQKSQGFLQNWRIELSRGNQYLFIYDHNTNMWNMINT